MLSVTDRGEPVRDGIKLQRLQQLLCTMMDSQGNGVVNIKAVRSVKQSKIIDWCHVPADLRIDSFHMFTAAYCKLNVGVFL